jgi:hypothetical protein
MITHSINIYKPATTINTFNINNDTLTTTCSQYNLNTTAYNVPFTFTGGTASDIKFTGSTFEFHNANLIEGLQVKPNPFFPFVINSDVLVNGNLIVTGSIVKETSNQPISQGLVNQFKQILQGNIRGIPNI